ncbi:MAG TPA: response regulator [Polyangiaceae bacterium]|nr:response regulator [Polyangiaceae bacterium]
MSAGRLLVVDDSPTVRKLVELTFPGTGWQIEFAGTGGEALQLAKQAVPDVVLLDFLLPDMRGTDVCERLSRDERTAHVPVVVMSGKGPSISSMFQQFASFSGCIGKPSTSAQIRGAVDAAFARGQASTRVSKGGRSFKQREAAAKLVYSLLREALGQIPRLMAELGDAAPAPYFAKKLLTPELVGRMLDALAPEPEPVAASVAPSARTLSLVDDSSFHGSVTGWPVASLFACFESSGRTGELTIAFDGKVTIAYLRAGEVIFVTNRDPKEYLRGSLPTVARLANVPREALRAAETQQRETAIPLFVSLAAAGLFPLAELTEILRTRGRKLLLDAIEASAATFSWRDISALPAHVEAHGRHVSTARNTLVFGADDEAPPPSLSLKQMALERLRQEPPQSLPAVDSIFSRAPGFSSQVQHFELTGLERRVLALVDGQTTGKELGSRAGSSVVEVMPVLARLTDVGLLRVAHQSSSHSSRSKARPLMILEPDVDGFQGPLSSLLQNRAEPVALLDLAVETDVIAAVRRERPRAVILNAASGGAAETARQLRSESALAGLVLVAVLEPQMANQAAELIAAGFDRALVKPIPYSEIERLVS